MIGKDIEESPTPEVWKALYEAAVEFKDLAPWGWMRDSDLFGVRNPQDNEIGYCCVLGKAGEVFGLTVYLGTEGLEEYLKDSQEDEDAIDDDALHRKNCLLLTFEDKKYLKKPDLNVIKNLGLEFSGRKAWPLFRNYRPGYFPWYLTANEAEFLTVCLRQANDVVRRFKENPNLFSSPGGETRYVRIQDVNMEWKDAWLKPAPLLRKMVLMVKSIDEERLENIRKECTRQKETWEIDYFYAPMYIAEKSKRPYFPVALLFADRYSYFILNAHVSNHDNFRTEFFEELFKIFEEHKTIPEKIAVRKDEFILYLKPFSERLGIKVSMATKLRVIDSARKHMFEHFKKTQND
ncbi:MAG: hypothetical protein ISS34_00265 [Candidatus Omnitrophica bacterium]|nr:hypothetical protein [Candidatus Omnitrophota bacterium]